MAVTNEAVGAAVSAALCLAMTPYLARLTRTVPDRENKVWYRGAQPTRRVVEFTALTALVLGGLAGAAAGWSALLPAFVAIAALGTPLVVIDYEHHRLPNRLVYPAAGAAVVLLALAAAIRGEWHDYLRAIEGGAATYVVLFVLMFISPRSFGWGDVRVGGVLGLYLGYFSWVAVYFGIFGGFVLGTVVAIVLMITGRANRKTPIAFGPMLLLGALLVLAFNLTPTIGN
jgi:leader peptidase (prepilin peptidase)/N-methyltransferase